MTILFYAVAGGAAVGSVHAMSQGDHATAWQLAQVMLVAAGLIVVTAVVRRVRGAR